MNEEITGNIFYQRGYTKGWDDSQEYLAKKFNKLLIKAKTEAYDKGYKQGANQKNNDPCVCGFWGKTHSNKLVSDWHDECLEESTEQKQEYMIVDWNRPHGHEKVPTKGKIMLTKDEAYDLNNLLTLNGENKRYVKCQ